MATFCESWSTSKAHEMATFYSQHPIIQTGKEIMSMNLVNNIRWYLDSVRHSFKMQHVLSIDKRWRKKNLLLIILPNVYFLLFSFLFRIGRGSSVIGGWGNEVSYQINFILLELVKSKRDSSWQYFGMATFFFSFHPSILVVQLLLCFRCICYG